MELGGGGHPCGAIQEDCCWAGSPSDRDTMGSLCVEYNLESAQASRRPGGLLAALEHSEQQAGAPDDDSPSKEEQVRLSRWSIPDPPLLSTPSPTPALFVALPSTDPTSGLCPEPSSSSEIRTGPVSGWSVRCGYFTFPPAQETSGAPNLPERWEEEDPAGQWPGMEAPHARAPSKEGWEVPSLTGHSLFPHQ